MKDFAFQQAWSLGLQKVVERNQVVKNLKTVKLSLLSNWWRDIVNLGSKIYSLMLMSDGKAQELSKS